MEADEDYFARRAREEREAGERASSTEARNAHLALAQRLQDVADALASASAKSNGT